MGLVDAIATHRVGDILRTHHDEVAPVLRAWAVDDDLWVRRTASWRSWPARRATDTDLLAFVVEHNLEGSPYGSEFFVRKAVGWALREYAKIDPDWVRSRVASYGDRLSGLSRREALRNLPAVD